MLRRILLIFNSLGWLAIAIAALASCLLLSHHWHTSREQYETWVALLMLAGIVFSALLVLRSVWYAVKDFLKAISPV